MSSARRPTPLGVPTDMLSVVKKVRPIKPGDLQSPYSIDMPANAWGLGITYPQSIKRLGHFLTADCKSAGTPNGGWAYPAQRKTPLFIFVCADTTRMAEGQGKELWVQDLSAVSENILLAAHAMGLGACWTTHLSYPEESEWHFQNIEFGWQHDCNNQKLTL